MAAIVDLMEYNGTAGSQTGTAKTSQIIRFKKADNPTVDNLNPLSRPSSGLFDRSTEKWLRLRIGNTGPTGSITNIRFYTSGSAGTGLTYYARTSTQTAYQTPAIPASDTGTTDVTTYTSGARRLLGAGPYTGTNLDVGEYLVMHLRVADTVTAPQNPTPNLTLNFSYDET